MMSFQDYLYEQAKESRHNEIIVYMIFLPGSGFFVGGALSLLSIDGEPDWLLFIPYAANNTQAHYLELAFRTIELLLIAVGTGTVFINSEAEART